MRLRDPRNASLLILATDSVVIGVIILVTVSLGIGFFVGYKINEWTKGVTPFQTASPPKSSPADLGKAADEAGKAAEPAAGQTREEPKPVQQAAAIPEPKSPPPPPETKQESPAGRPDAPPPAETKANGSVGGEAGRKPAETGPKQAKADPRPGKAVKEAAAPRKPQARSGAAAEEEKTASAVPARVYTIQVGAFPQKEEAEQLRESLTAKGHKAYIVHEGGEDPYFRVRVGKFRDRKATEQAADALRERTGDNYIILVTKP